MSPLHFKNQIQMTQWANRIIYELNFKGSVNRIAIAATAMYSLFEKVQASNNQFGHIW
jgi:hypothetical protein